MTHLAKGVQINEGPQGFPRLVEFAQQLGVGPNRGQHAYCMLGTDGEYYDVFALGLKLLEKLRELPKLPDVVRQLDHTTDEAIRRRADLDKAHEQIERLRVQLAGCLAAADGAHSEAQQAPRGSYGWSPAYQAVLELRQRFDEVSEELERRRLAGGAVQVVDAAQQAAYRGAIGQGSKVVFAALNSQSGECRVAAERLIREHGDWYASVELRRFDKEHVCPACEKPRSEPCCHGGCAGDWGTGCYHCHSAMFMDWKQAKALLLKRRDEKKRGGDDG
jgi:hypothetical protein